MNYYDSFHQECKSNDMDIKLKFVIKKKVIYCSKILFWLQSQLNDKIYEDEFVVEEKGATVRLVRKFVNWIESRNKDLVKLGKLETKEYLILEKLAQTYKIQKLSNKIYKKLENDNNKSHQEVKDFQRKFNFTLLNEEIKKEIIEDADLYLYYDYNISFTVLRSLNYQDKVEILRRVIKEKNKEKNKGKITSLLSFLFIFKKEEINSKNLIDLVPLFQSSQKGFSFIISKIYERINISCESQVERDKNRIENDEDQTNHKTISQDLKTLKEDFKKLQEKSEKLFDEYTMKINEYNAIDKQLKYFEEKSVDFKNALNKQTAIIKEKWNDDYTSNYNSIKKEHDEYQKTVKKVKDESASYNNLVNLLKIEGRNNYIISKIFTYNLSYRYVNDSISTILQTDYAQNEKETFPTISHSFTEDQANSFIIDFGNNNQIFNPLYYKLGFYHQPSFCSWEILAKFQYIENSNNNNKDKVSSNDNEDKNINNDNEDKNINNDNKDKASNNENKDKASNSENKDKDSNNENKDKDSNNENKDKDSNNVIKKQLEYKCYETKDNNNEEWVLIDYHYFDELPHPDESYDPEWDDPFILQFKFLPGLFPQSIKLHLKDIKNPDNQDQISLKKCFNNFQITGILG